MPGVVFRLKLFSVEFSSTLDSAESRLDSREAPLLLEVLGTFAHLGWVSIFAILPFTFGKLTSMVFLVLVSMAWITFTS